MNKQKQLLLITKDDFIIQTFRVVKSGQNQNKRDTGVRIIHRIRWGEARDEIMKIKN